MLEEKGLVKEEKGLVKKEAELPAAQQTAVGKLLNSHEKTLGQHVAMKALELVKPMIQPVAQELTDTLGDNEVIIVIRNSGKGTPTSITMLNTSEDFTIKGKKANRTPIIDKDTGKITGYLDEGKFMFRGEAIPGTKKLKAVKNNYIAEHWVDMLLSGRIVEMSKELMK